MSRSWAASCLIVALAVLLPLPAEAWYCKAVARDQHFGWASYVDRHRARDEALRECAERSRVPLTCHVINCVPD